MPPPGQYLPKIGELAYLVSQLEWEIIGDIRLSVAEIDSVRRLGMSTGSIGRALEDSARGLEHRPSVHHFVSTAARALLDVADRRKAVLHASPGTTPSGHEQLLRLREGPDGQPERFWIDEAYLNTQIARVNYWIQRVRSARLHPLA